ncbi:primase homolog protein isoform X2 [Syzygium oleosum]|uniref:primase homolog protein isoform X2 n=1 Tax=Syzygium oleosum TaxID=219896 RepID=UPI0024B9DD65|nr:primase homolog protein isoform X2 [Syzygium oleosum]
MPFGVAPPHHHLSSCPRLFVRIKPDESFGLSTALRRSVRCSRTESVPPEARPQHSKGGAADMAKLRELEQKVELLGIGCEDHSRPGFYSNLFCPKCRGGRKVERSLSFHIVQSGEFAMWRCFRMECGWAGQAFADSGNSCDGDYAALKVRSTVQMTEESLRLEPLSDKIIGYFAERKISVETLQRNGVKQLSGKQSAISFPYKRKGELVGCKYRTLDKKFWQEKGTEKALYGLDDISEADEIVIVEGEIDKLSLEEAGFINCASVPGGAPGKVSNKELPYPDKDTAYQYLWNCKDYLDKASRIILATDGDAPGQALAEELAKRLGKQRCWKVNWPKKDDFSRFNDANEVLKHLGPTALMEAIEHADSMSPTSSGPSNKGVQKNRELPRTGPDWPGTGGSHGDRSGSQFQFTRTGEYWSGSRF